MKNALRSWPEDAREWQPGATDHLISDGDRVLWQDMGMGKTTSALFGIKELIDRCDIRRALVVAPLRVCRKVWRQEAEKWAQTQDIKIGLVHGSPKQKRAILEDPSYDVHLINYEGIKWLIETYLGLELYKPANPDLQLPWDLLVWDEVSKMKHVSSQRATYARKIFRLFDRRWALTGTPAPNGLADIFGQMYFTDTGATFGGSRSRYLKQFFVKRIVGDREKYVPRNPDLIYEALGDIVLRVDADDYGLKHDVLTNDIWVDLPEKNREQYEQMEDEMFLDLDTVADGVEIFNTAALTSKCHQFTGGHLYAEIEKEGGKPDRVTLPIHKAKLDALEDVLEEAGGSPMLIVYSFNHERDAIRERFGIPALGVGSAKQDDELLDQWDRGELAALLIHPQSAGHGLNMQSGGHILTFYSMTWNLEHYDQTIGRLAGGLRGESQEHGVIVHRLIIPDTIDVVMGQTLSDKAADQGALLAALRAYQKEKQAA